MSYAALSKLEAIIIQAYKREEETSRSVSQSRTDSKGSSSDKRSFRTQLKKKPKLGTASQRKPNDRCSLCMIKLNQTRQMANQRFCKDCLTLCLKTTKTELKRL